MGDPTTIRVTLWYEEMPARVDPSLPPMDPFGRLPPPAGAEQGRLAGPVDGTEQTAREEPRRAIAAPRLGNAGEVTMGMVREGQAG